MPRKKYEAIPMATEIPHHQEQADLSDDLLFGAKRIADYLGLKERQARHQIEAGHISVKRMGGVIVGSKSSLRRQLIPET
jgi:hypothetical protein